MKKPNLSPLFSCRHNGRSYELHTHAFAEHVIYLIGWNAFTSQGSTNLQLTSDASTHCCLSLNQSFKLQKTLTKLKIPGGKMAKK